jgi:hypothetical protein
MNTGKLTPAMVAALRCLANSEHNYMPASLGTRRALVRRGLVRYELGHAYFTDAGRKALETAYLVLPS